MEKCTHDLQAVLNVWQCRLPHKCQQRKHKKKWFRCGIFVVIADRRLTMFFEPILVCLYHLIFLSWCILRRCVVLLLLLISLYRSCLLCKMHTSNWSTNFDSFCQQFNNFNIHKWIVGSNDLLWKIHLKYTFLLPRFHFSEALSSD